MANLNSIKSIGWKGLFFLIILGLTAPVLAIDERDLCSDPEKVFAFAEHLYEIQDYLNAIREYRRMIFLAPCHPLSKKAKLKIGFAYKKDEKWDEAIASFQKVADEYLGQEEGRTASFELGETVFLQRDYDKAIKFYRAFLKSYPTDEFVPEARFKLAWAYLYNKDYLVARGELEQIGPSTDYSITAKGLSQDIGQISDLPQRSPRLAGILSAIVPGSGQIYAGKVGNGVVALIINGLFIAAAIQAFDNDNDIWGGIISLIEIGWYGGNIFGGIASAHQYNRRIRDNYIEKLREKYKMEPTARNPQGEKVFGLAVITFRF